MFDSHEVEAMAINSLRLRDIWRWSVVNIPRRQSVAEHSYLVWAIGQHLYHESAIDRSSIEYNNLTYRLLTHDFEEASVGDLPSNIKQALEDKHPGLLASLISTLSDTNNTVKRVAPHYTEGIVKMADTVEALLFSLDNKANAKVIEFLENKFKKLVEENIKAWGTSKIDWRKAERASLLLIAKTRN